MKTSLRSFGLFALVLALFIPAFADTIRLKDGNVIRGQVIGFRDQQFTVLVGSGAQGRRSRTLVYVEDVESIEFDSATTAAAAALANDDTQTSNNSTPPYQPPRSTRAGWIPAEYHPAQLRNLRPALRQHFSPSRLVLMQSSARYRRPRRGMCAKWWTNTGLVVRQGQRLRISSTGRVSLGGGRFSTPAGIPAPPDSEKLMRTEATGALIAVIGDDNDDFLLIGTGGIL